MTERGSRRHEESNAASEKVEQDVTAAEIAVVQNLTKVRRIGELRKAVVREGHSPQDLAQDRSAPSRGCHSRYCWPATGRLEGGRDRHWRPSRVDRRPGRP